MGNTKPVGIAWIVALEAASFFSLTTWMFAVDRAWPADNPREFALIVLLGASVATLLCHIAPAIWARRTAGMAAGPVMRWLAVPLVAWLLAGAGVSLEDLARDAGGMWTVFREAPVWRTVADGVAIVLGIVSCGITWGRTAWKKAAVVAGLALGISMIAGSLIGQWRGIWIPRDLPFTDDPQRVFEGMVLAAALAAILAVQIGSKCTTVSKVYWTGLLGMWAPLVLSVTLGSLAKVGGVRLHSRASIPIGFAQALLVSPVSLARTIVITAGLTLVAPCWISAIWIRELMELLNWTRRATAAALAGAVVYYWFPLTYGGWLKSSEYESWCWSVVALGPLLAIASFFLRRRQAC